MLKDLPDERSVRRVLSEHLPWEVLRTLPPVDLVPGAVCRTPVYRDALAMVHHDAPKHGVVVYNRRMEIRTVEWLPKVKAGEKTGDAAER